MQELWQQELKTIISSSNNLLKLLNLDKSPTKEFVQENAFKLKVPKCLLKRINIDEENSPLLKQFLPTIFENNNPINYENDPLLESKFTKIPGLIHKYHSRVLLIISTNCAVNCRFCFRKAFPYKNNCVNKNNFDKIIEYIQNEKTIDEVIFSGGDPLTQTDENLSFFSEQLAKIKHLSTIRIHSRMPILIPNRITENFLKWFGDSRLKPVLVMHCNHSNEIDENVIEKCQLMKRKNITLLNQTVLLKDINDNAKTLAKLSKQLFFAGVIPYYIHMLDKVTGSSHFEVSIEKAMQIYNELKTKLPGYLLPKFVKEIPNSKSKIAISEVTS